MLRLRQTEPDLPRPYKVNGGIAGKKIGGAVVRNAAKRRLRAVVHDIGGPWNGVDVAFMAKPLLLNAPYDKVVDACFHALEGHEFFDSTRSTVR